MEMKANGDAYVMKNEGLRVKDADGTLRKVALETQLNLKANQTTVDTALNLKANQTDADAALDLKANQTTVDTALNLKADQNAVDMALGLKADQTTVNTNSQTLAGSVLPAIVAFQAQVIPTTSSILNNTNVGATATEGAAASVNIVNKTSGTGVDFNFVLPRGDQGEQGIQGGLRGGEFCTICPFFAHFSNFTNFPKVPSFQAHSPVKTAPCRNANKRPNIAKHTTHKTLPKRDAISLKFPYELELRATPTTRK